MTKSTEKSQLTYGEVEISLSLRGRWITVRVVGRTSVGPRPSSRSSRFRRSSSSCTLSLVETPNCTGLHPQSRLLQAADEAVRQERQFGSIQDAFIGAVAPTVQKFVDANGNLT